MVIVTGDTAYVALGVKVFDVVTTGVRVAVTVFVTMSVWVGSATKVFWYVGVLVAVSISNRNGRSHDARLDRTIPVIKMITHSFNPRLLHGII
jgi:hypothetical protein